MHPKRPIETPRTILSRLRLSRALVLGLVLAAIAPSACGDSTVIALVGVDISPDQVNGVPADDGASTSGLIHSLAGDEKTLYAVSLNAGVWRSVGGGAWAQLPHSPQRAFSIAVDPANPQHIAVGERDGDANTLADNHSGIRESYDSGDSFGEYFDPSLQGKCGGSQATPSLTFTHQNSVLVAATACGVAYKTGKGQPWQFATNPPAFTPPVTAVAASDTKVWARNAAGTLIVSIDNAQTWRLATQQPLPAGTTFPSRGDIFSLAATDDDAFMLVGGDDNFNALLIYDSATAYGVKYDRWVVQRRIFDPADNVKNDPNYGTGNGTGCGGHRFVHVFKVPAVEGPPISQVALGVGQDMLLATSQDPRTGLFTWERIAAGGCGSPGIKNRAYQPNVHSDFWDLLVSPTGTLWLASDGGVFENHQDGKGWLKRNQGLHTQHVHMLYAAPLGTAYAYPTSDNAAWFKGFTGDWQHDNVGDSNWVVGDINTHPLFAYVARNPQCNTLTGFDDKVPDLDIANPGTAVADNSLAADKSLDGPLTFTAIQTLWSGDAAPSQFDAVMLANMPLQYQEARDYCLGPHPTQYFTALTDNGQSLAIVRNQHWINHPDISDAKGQGWELMADNLPPGTVGFLVANGHKNSALFVLAGPDINHIDLYRWDGNLHGTWTKLPVNGQGQPSQLLMGGMKGPVFVNPYKADDIYALTATGIRHSTDRGTSWSAETALTSAVTGNGTYPLTGTFAGGNGTNIDLSSRANPMGTLADMSFDPVFPTHVVAASPFTGVFYNDGTGTWRDLRDGLPAVFTPVSAVSLFGSVVVVAMEGRGLWQIRNV
jgi:hypothetical protein